ncbi:hypothetical protein K438DRAFT_1991370 [Mycena galopus ATCC 62051]|nr:hypothetical protein K438DRAFT_1991370 [Mycena galopus ATCC 62051]
MPPDANTQSPADREYLDSLTARQLMDFRDYTTLTASNIKLNAGKFLDDKWVDISLFREYMQRTAQSSTVDASGMRSRAPDSTRIKTEALPPVFSLVKAEPQKITLSQSGDFKMHALTEDGHEVFELLSDSDADEELNSDQEVIEALRRSSRSSSIVASSFPDSTVHDDLDGYNDDLDGDTVGCGLSHDDHLPAKDKFSPAPVDPFPLVESDTIWHDDGKSFVRETGVFRPNRSLTVEWMEYCDGPASIYPIHRTRTGLVVDMSDEKYNF